MSRKSTTRRSSVIPPETTSNELNDSEGRLGIDDILEIDPWKDMEKFEVEQVGLIQGIIDEFSEKVRIDNGKKRKSSGKSRASSRPTINKASTSSVKNCEIDKSVEREPIGKEPNKNFENLEKSSPISCNDDQRIATDEREAITIEERISELIKANDEMKRRLNSNKRVSSGPMMNKEPSISTENDEIEKGPMTNKASRSSAGIGTMKKSVEREPIDKGMNKNSENFENSSSSTSSNDEQFIATDEQEVITIEGKISKLVKIPNETKQRLNRKKRASLRPMINKASSDSSEIGTMKKLVEREPIDKGPNKNSENFEKSSSSISSNDEQLIAADESKLITMREKLDTGKKTVINLPILASKTDPIPEKTASAENLKFCSNVTEKSMEKKVAGQISSIDRKSLVQRGNIVNTPENNKAIDSESVEKSREIKQKKIESIVKAPTATGQNCKRDIGLPLNKKKSKSDKNIKKSRRKNEKLAKAFEKFGKKFARVSHKMGYQDECKTEDSSSGSDADETNESTSSSSTSSSTSSTSSSCSSSTCSDCRDSSSGSSCSCSSCCTDDDFTEFTLTSSSDSEESDSSSSFSENDEKK